MRLTLRVFVVVTGLVPFTASAQPGFVPRVPNGASQSCITCHQVASPNESNKARNPFGAAFDAAGRSWSAALCADDADDDGQTNGQELGDPACVWSTGATPARTTSLSLPGDATSTSDNPEGVDVTEAPDSDTGGSDADDEAGGCSSTTSNRAPLAAILFAGLLLRRRRR
ncbi:MAG: hypothetical protein ACO3JL_04685 [Myxococcota bacterium]